MNQNKKKLFNRKMELVLMTMLLIVGILYVTFGDKKKKQAVLNDDELSIPEGAYSINMLLGEEILSVSDLKKEYGEAAIKGEDMTLFLDRIGIEDDVKGDLYRKYASKNPLTRTQWLEMLKTIASSIGMQDTVVEKQISVFHIMQGEETNLIISDEKIYTYYGGERNGKYYVTLDTVVDAVVRNESIIFISSVQKSDNLYENVLITENDGEHMIVSLNGSQREFVVEGLNENLSNVVADLEISNGKVNRLVLKRDGIKGKVLAISDEEIEIEGYGKIRLSEKCRYFLGYKGFEQTDKGIVKIGSDKLMFIVANQFISAVILQNGENEKNIRVLLKSTGYQSLFHDHVSLSCQGNYLISYYENDESGEIHENVTEHAPEEIVEINPEDERLRSGRIKITPVEQNKKTTIHSISRNNRNPEYRGTIEVSNYDGKLVVINDISLEEYLYAVVPSEMPTSYGTEALKVQAVCARSYAISHLGDNMLGAYGAQVDDSTDYQVYNNTEENETSIEAVDQTYGEVLRYGEEIANTYFFATSCGSTTDATIWGREGLPYVKGKLLADEDDNLHLEDNVEFSQFIKQDFVTYDSGTSWYRWNFTMTEKQLSDTINENLESLCKKNPDKILVKKQDGSFVQEPVSNIGNVHKIIIDKRLCGGVIDEMTVEGEKAVIKVLKQSVIRNIINPYGIEIHKNDGTTIDTFSSIPSAFFTVEKVDGKYLFYGGGFGHGAGMSQTAVKNMIASGKTYEEVLTFFYTDVEISNYY
ncbi:MAG: SpoIID/LytB domain-containing protein [Lachnospiraceae bacterium]|nr:SpoIID/LytB domain-containing protein [Lachnospiraceae bacterium]